MIIRREHRRNYTVVSNEVIEDGRLSYDALGLLTFLLSRPDDWEVHVNHLRRRGGLGRDKMNGIVAQLQEGGYLRYELSRNDRGVLTGGRWIVREDPGLGAAPARKRAPGADKLAIPPSEDPDAVPAGFSGIRQSRTHNKDSFLTKPDSLPKTDSHQATFSLRENVRPQDESRIVVEQAMAIYNDAAAECSWPRAQRLTDRRKAALLARIREVGGIAGWQAAMDKARASPFLRGETGRSPEHENWRPEIDFFVRASVFTKLMEGGYDRANHRHPRRSGPHDSIFAALAESVAKGPRGGEREAASDGRDEADRGPASPNGEFRDGTPAPPDRPSGQPRRP
jgi:hypothetical protein